MTEATLQRSIVHAIKRAHPAAWIHHPVGGPYQMPGIPDLLVCVEGLFVGLEIKFIRPGETREHALGRATAQQRLQVAAIVRAGGSAAVVTSVPEALEILAAALARREEDVLRLSHRPGETLPADTEGNQSDGTPDH